MHSIFCVKIVRQYNSRRNRKGCIFRSINPPPLLLLSLISSPFSFSSPFLFSQRSIIGNVMLHLAGLWPTKRERLGGWDNIDRGALETLQEMHDTPLSNKLLCWFSWVISRQSKHAWAFMAIYLTRGYRCFFNACLPFFDVMPKKGGVMHITRDTSPRHYSTSFSL